MNATAGRPDAERCERAARAARTAGWLLLAPLGLVAAAVAWLSLDWRMVLDTPLLHYMAFMLDEQGAVPYRDVFVTSFPGALLLHWLILSTVGHGDGPFMAFNLVWVGLLLAATARVLAPLGARVATAGCVLFALAYFREGPDMMLQRDFALILPLAAALAVHVAGRWSAAGRALLIGLAFGLAASVKPHAAIGLPAVLLAEWLRAGGRSAGPRALLRLAAAGGAGCALPVGAMLAWVAASGGWSAFVEMTGSYIPMHVTLSRNHTHLEGAQRLLYHLYWLPRFGETPGWLVASAVGLFASLSTGALAPERRRLVLLLAALLGLYVVYVCLAGQYWGYHWMPAKYFACLLAALCVVELPGLGADRLLRLVPPGALLAGVLLVLPVPDELIVRLQGQELAPPDEGRVDAIAGFLAEHLEPGDTVQPFDWAAGGVHAMLQARAAIATPYVSDYHFYHHVDEPLVQELRRRFVADLERARPRFLVDVELRPKPKGAHTTREFPALADFVARSYEPALAGKGWRVYERVR